MKKSPDKIMRVSIVNDLSGLPALEVSALPVMSINDEGLIFFKSEISGRIDVTHSEMLLMDFSERDSDLHLMVFEHQAEDAAKWLVDRARDNILESMEQNKRRLDAVFNISILDVGVNVDH